MAVFWLWLPGFMALPVASGTPFINLVTKGCVPNVEHSGMQIIVDNADQAVFSAE